MRTRAMYPTCLVILLTAVLSSAWAFTAPTPNISQPTLTPEQQKALNDARNAQNAGSGNTTGATDKPDTNEAMESSQQKLINAQATAATRQQSADNLSGITQDGTLLKKPENDYADVQSRELLAAQKEYCGKLPATVGVEITGVQITAAEKNKACFYYFSIWFTGSYAKYSQEQPISKYCYEFMGKQNIIEQGMFGKETTIQVICEKKPW